MYSATVRSPSHAQQIATATHLPASQGANVFGIPDHIPIQNSNTEFESEQTNHLIGSA